MKSILFVEDDAKIRGSVVCQLREEGFAVEAYGDAEGALSHLRSHSPDLLILDVRLPGMSGIELVSALTQSGHIPPTIIVSGEASISETVQALRLGVHDFIEKPFSRERLLHSVHNTLKHAALIEEVASLRSNLDGEGSIIGESKALAEMRERISKAAASDATVLIRGESGTGKELVASAMHFKSPRRQGPFIKLNCAAIPATLVEDELFGHARGAFTDAKTAKPGLFEEADSGTLFLDEIGDMPTPLQARLLRVLEDGSVRRIGETKDRLVNVRVVASTNRDLESAIAAGEFREDLFFRLAHLIIEVPPLRQRAGDVRRLVSYFIEVYCRRNRMRLKTMDEEAMAALEAYSWPGNIRECKHLVERLVIFGADPITLDQLPAGIVQPVSSMPIAPLVLPELAAPMTLKDFRLTCEREYILQILLRTGWNCAAAARILGIGRTYLHDKLASLGIRRPEVDSKF